MITNSGLIQTSGSNAHAIFNENSNNVSIFNSGYLLAQGAGSDGIQSSSANLEITNGGTIESQQGFALNLLGDNPTLTSLQCSKIIGPVFSEELLNFNVPNSFNMILTLTEESAGFGEVSINAPFVQMGNTIAVLDVSSFNATVDIVADLSDTLLNSLSNPCFSCCTARGASLWVQGLGSTRERGSGVEGYRYRQGGFLAGVTSKCFGGAPLSVFGGAVFGKGRPSEGGCNGSADLDTTSYVGGVSYVAPFCSGCISLGAQAGSLEIDQKKRIVFDNLAQDGFFETGGGKRSGFFLTTEAAVQQRFTLLSCPLSFAGALRYADFYPTGDYRESFGEGELFLENRSLSILTARLLVGVPLNFMVGSCPWNVEPYIGTSRRFQLSSRNYSGTFFDEPISFSPDFGRNIASYLYGFKACYTVCNAEFYATFEGDFENEKSHRYMGSAGLGYRF